MDGFCSAFVFKKYWKYLIPELNEEEVKEAEIILAYPRDIQEGLIEFTNQDVILDLPRPDEKILFWCDHHSSNKTEDLPDNNHWKIHPSNAGLLLEIAEKNGLELDAELKSFKEASEIIDAADYTKEQIEDCYYPSSKELSDLMKMHMIATMFHTRDAELNTEIFLTLLKDLGKTPLTTESLWQLKPKMFFRAQLRSMQVWRETVDPYIELLEEEKCVLQDDRKRKLFRGVPDRFYSFIKFPEASYSFVLKPLDNDLCRIGLGSNIFDKKRCKVDIGEICREVGKQFGKGSGGGHYYVGGATIDLDKIDEAKKFILEKLKR